MTVIGLVVLVSGCASQPQIEYRYKTVEVPVYKVPDVTIPTAPYLPVWDIKENDTDGQVVKAYVISLDESQLYAKQLRIILDAILSQKQ